MFGNERHGYRTNEELLRGTIVKPGTRAKRVARNTLLYTHEDGSKRVRLHTTDILTLTPDGQLIVADGGWDTVTTRARIYEFSAKLAGVRLNVYRENGVRYVAWAGVRYPWLWDTFRLWNGVAVQQPEDEAELAAVRSAYNSARKEKARERRAARKEREHAARVARFGGEAWFAAYECALADAKQARRDARRKRCARKRR